MNYYISDTHFSHENIIAFDDRPFSSAEEMNEALNENWNHVVAPEDINCILGDFHWGKSKEWPAVLERLTGHKQLIRGNHDLKMPLAPEVKKFFDDVKDYKEIRDGEEHVVLCHYPIPCFKNMYYGWLHLYGHVHMTTEHNMTNHFFRTVESYYGFPKRAFNVGCMLPYMAYTPRTLKEIISSNQEG